MVIRNWLLVIGMYGCLTVQAQSTSTAYTFRIRYEDYSIFANARFIINGQQLATDPQGIIKTSLKSSAIIADVQSADPRVYQVKYPVDGHVILPKDAGTLVDIFIARPSADVAKTLSAQMDRSQAKMESALVKKIEDQSNKTYKDIIALLSKTSVNKSVLMKGRLEFLPLITQALNEYLNDARNFNDAFLAVGNSPDKDAVVKQLEQSIYSYNKIYELINTNKSTYEQAIATYWNSRELSLKFSSLVDYTLDKIHKPYILEVNYTYINRINQYLEIRNRKEKNAAKTALQTDIQTYNASLDRRLTALGERVSAFITLLNNNQIATN